MTEEQQLEAVEGQCVTQAGRVAARAGGAYDRRELLGIARIGALRGIRQANEQGYDGALRNHIIGCHIKWELARFQREGSSHMGMSGNAQQRMGDIKRWAEEYERTEGRAPSDEEVNSAFNCKWAGRALRATNSSNTEYVDETVDEGEDVMDRLTSDADLRWVMSYIDRHFSPERKDAFLSWFRNDAQGRRAYCHAHGITYDALRIKVWEARKTLLRAFQSA